LLAIVTVLFCLLAGFNTVSVPFRPITYIRMTKFLHQEFLFPFNFTCVTLVALSFLRLMDFKPSGRHCPALAFSNSSFIITHEIGHVLHEAQNLWIGIHHGRQVLQHAEESLARFFRGYKLSLWWRGVNVLGIEMMLMLGLILLQSAGGRAHGGTVTAGAAHAVGRSRVHHLGCMCLDSVWSKTICWKGN